VVAANFEICSGGIGCGGIDSGGIGSARREVRGIFQLGMDTIESAAGSCKLRDW
jgi:hypothetical protein